MDLTEKMVENRIFDSDHSMVNIVPIQNDTAARLDLECAHIAPRRRLAERIYGLMIGRLIGSYVFTVQPDVSCMSRFSNALLDRLRPSAAVLRTAESQLQEMLSSQLEGSSIDTEFSILG